MIPTYEQQRELVRQGFATAKVNGHLTTFKYHRKVMYDNLWATILGIMECRGHTYDNRNGNLVLLPPRKTFDYLQDDTWADVDADAEVYLFKKFNGFMAAVSVYEGEVIVSTTGTTNSDFVKLAEKYIFKTWPKDLIKKNWPEGGTWLFEICATEDPHIVYEKPGAYYLGFRDHLSSNFIPSNWKGEYVKTTLGEALDHIKNVRHEGFMMYDKNLENCCKLKSPYYKGKKLLMRAPDLKVRHMYNNPSYFACVYAGKMFTDVIAEITRNIDKAVWMQYDAQARRQIIEDFMGEN